MSESYPSVGEAAQAASDHSVLCPHCSGDIPVVERANEQPSIVSDVLTLEPADALLVLSEPELAGDLDVNVHLVDPQDLAGRVLIALALLPEGQERTALIELYRLTQAAAAADRKVVWS